MNMTVADLAREPFQAFLLEAARTGEAVNPVFEQRLFELAAVLHKISDLLDRDGIPHELVGGLALLVHVEAADPAQSMLTRDVDVMINRADLERVKEAAASEGFRFRHSAGWDMLLYGESTSAGNAMHLLFSGERVRPAQVMPNPSIAPESKPLLGRDVMVIPAADLLRMKLSSFRLKDQVHVQVMDAAGLIPPEAAEALPVELRKHLEYIRMQE